MRRLVTWHKRECLCRACVVTTGGTSGIGEVAAEALAKMGAHIILVARNTSHGMRLWRGFAEVRPETSTRYILLTLHAADPVRAIRALRMQKDQHQVGHTIHPSGSGRQASERHPYCHRESVAPYL